MTEAPTAAHVAGTVEVRLRHVDAEEGVTLGYFPADGLKKLHALLLRWGLYDEDGVAYSNNNDTSLHGAFKATSMGAYFEFVMEPNE